MEITTRDGSFFARACWFDDSDSILVVCKREATGRITCYTGVCVGSSRSIEQCSKPLLVHDDRGLYMIILPVGIIVMNPIEESLIAN